MFLAGLRARFAATLCADRSEDRKPSPNMLLAACARVGVEPEHMLYIGDSVCDIATARAAKCRVVAVSYGYTDHDVLAQAQPDNIVGSFASIPAIGLRPGPILPELRVVS